MGVPEFDDKNFDSEVLQASGPVLVDFWAPWCGPCRQIAPVIEQLAGENQGTIKIGKLNVDEAPELGPKLRREQHPHLDVVQERRSRGSVCRRAAKDEASASDRRR